MPSNSFDPLIHIHDSNLELFKCLSQSSGKRPRLPPELIFQIFALPSRWVLVYSNSLSGPTSVGSGEGERVIVGTPRLNDESISLARKIVFTFTSKDQGWSSFPQDRGTLRNSWTWFEVGIIRDGQKFAPGQGEDGSPSESVYSLRRNKHAWPEWEKYCIEFDAGNQLYADLQDGDAVVLWAKASFPGWTNNVREATVEIWCEDNLKELQEST